ncbi:MAG TPA: ABC transporter permease [Candidatus Aveggerthella stercoripullorum]|uniref:ABC transporter permease n=1 Tax=Candidatus Aveggerthella stercoripullorum TaxID=2840688 RepID=A0A9D1A1F2_9ACTN|nr:ABC transporter permease [Candidatus Aveggerthella stercoripullorum]
MSAALRKTGALLAKDFADLLKNPTLLVVCLLPIAFMALYSFMVGDAAGDAGIAAEQQEAVGPVIGQFMLGSALCMTVGMVCTMTVLYGIAEEKEKRTLRTLMLANVGASQVVASKAVVALAASAAVNAVCFFVAGGEPGMLGAYLALGVVGSLPVILFSLVLGLASRDQMTAGVYSVPVLLVALVPMFGMANETIEKVSHWLPTGGVYDLIGLAVGGRLFSSDALAPLAVTAAWAAVGAVVFAALFKRLARDN